MGWLKINIVLKVLGLFIIFICSVAFGTIKSSKIKANVSNLKSICVSTKQLAEYIKVDNSELSILIGKCFSKDLVYYNNRKIEFNKRLFDQEICNLLDEFFSLLGKNDRNSEYERTVFYSKLFENRLTLFEEKSRELCKLYNTLGVLCGFFLCIFFL